MKYIFILIIFLCTSTQANDTDPDLQSAFDKLANKRWDEAETLLKAYSAKSAEFYLVSVLWYGAQNNPATTKSIQSKT